MSLARVGALLISLGLISAGLALAKRRFGGLSPINPSIRTKKALDLLRNEFGRNYKYMIHFLPYIEAASRKYGVDPALVLAIIAQESRGNPYAVSSAGAIGLMQIMPSTARRLCGYSRDDLFDPVKNIDCGVRYLRYLMDRTETITDVIASYYAGEKAYRYRKRYGRYPSYGSPPVYVYVDRVYRRYRFLREVV